MKKALLFALALGSLNHLFAQDKKPAFVVAPRMELPDFKKTIRATQADLPLYTKNYADHSQEHDANSIILDIEKYINSMPKTQSGPDRMLVKLFNPLRHFFLTTTNKTSVAAMFLYSGTPYQFCSLNDTASVLYIHAVKDGSAYNLARTTEKRVMRTVFQNCLLPSLKAMDEFKESDVRYIALTVFYGCKDTREGAPAGVASYSLTLIARTADLQQYATGIITEKGLVANSELYAGEEGSEPARVQISMD